MGTVGGSERSKGPATRDGQALLAHAFLDRHDSPLPLGGRLSRVLPLFVALLAGCTAARAGVRIVSAESALSRARAEEADVLAPYEYVMAERYLAKAREEVQGSEYRVADALARASAEWADRSVISLKGRRVPEMQIEEVPEGQMPVPWVVEPPPPAVPTPEDEFEDFDKPEEEDDVDVGGGP